MADALVFGYVEDGNNGLLHCTDPKMSYEFVKDADVADKEEDPEWLDVSRLDYNMWLPHLQGTEYEDSGLPLSFLQVKTVMEGEQWYRDNTKMPECMIPYLAEYHWGTSELQLAQERKKVEQAEKRAKKKKKEVPSLSVKRGKFKVVFDPDADEPEIENEE